MYVQTQCTVSKQAFHRSAEDTPMTSIFEILGLGPVMPVVTLDDADDAIPLARALIAGGVRTIEVTLRTEAAFDAISRIRNEFVNIQVGAGTVTAPEQVTVLSRMRAHFAVSPGCLPSLIDASQRHQMPFLPGVMTPSEALGLRELGFRCVKFFPAVPAGGVGMVKAMSAVYPELIFCPTGGITQDTAPDWLALDAVRCVGGSWVAPRKLIAAKDFDAIERRAQAASSLR